MAVEVGGGGVAPSESFDEIFVLSRHHAKGAAVGKNEGSFHAATDEDKKVTDICNTYKKITQLTYLCSCYRSQNMF